jgi:DNA-3-methyladenine glycosylase II
MHYTFHEKNLQRICDGLGRKDDHLKQIIHEHGYPPFWKRGNSFATLIHIILEQQVSLASAKAAFNKLKEKIGTITPVKLLELSDHGMKACYFSRQKMVYARYLAKAIMSRQISLKKISSLPDEEIREQLKQIKGIGDWTVDVYLLFVLHRSDIFPVGDLAMINALKEVKSLPKHISKEEILFIAQNWQPYRSVATMLLWHYYIQTRNIKF